MEELEAREAGKPEPELLEIPGVMEEEVKLQDLPAEVTEDVGPQQLVIQEVIQAEVRVQVPDNAARRPIKTDRDSLKIVRARPHKTEECSKHLRRADNSSNKEIPVPMCTGKMRHVRACNKAELHLLPTEIHSPEACMVEAWEAEAWAAAWAEEAWEAAWAVAAVVVVDADENYTVLNIRLDTPI